MAFVAKLFCFHVAFMHHVTVTCQCLPKYPMLWTCTAIIFMACTYL